MKKRLLITLGCSLTEGVGCYDYTLLGNNSIEETIPGTPAHDLFYQKNRPRFHELGWPNRLGKKLGYDKVINLGSGGTGNSTHLKLFVDKISSRIEEYRREYDIFVIWLMTDPSRFSFYSSDRIIIFNPAFAGKFGQKKMEEAYVNDMPEIRIGPLREQIFLVKLAEGLFSSLGINFVFTSWVNTFSNFYFYYKSKHLISPKPYSLTPARTPNTISQVCNHPNEEGYEYIALELESLLKKYHTHFCHTSPLEQFEWEWNGGLEYFAETYEEKKSLF